MRPSICIVARLSVTGVELRGTLKMVQRVSGRSARRQRVAQVPMRPGGGGIEAERFLKLHDRGVESALRRERDPEIVVHFQ